VKKVDYYAQPWKMPKWLGFAIGGIFGTIVIGSAVLIVQLTKSPEPPKPVVAAAAAAVAAPVAQDEATPAPADAQDDAQPAPAHHERTVVAHSSRHSKKHDKHASKGMRVASAKPVISDAKAHEILARHQTKQTRANKDALDKLLGL
jgi:hypothetical protein